MAGSKFFSARNRPYSTTTPTLTDLVQTFYHSKIQMRFGPACGSYSNLEPQLEPLRWRVAASIFSVWDHFLRAICTCFCCPINRCESCLRGCDSFCNDLSSRWDDWYYRPPTARKFYAPQKRSRKRRLRISTGHELAMSNLLALDEPQELIRHQQEASGLQQEPQTIVCYLFYLNFAPNKSLVLRLGLETALRGRGKFSSRSEKTFPTDNTSLY